MAEISNPHDSFFKEAFSYTEAASDFVRFYLPEDVVAQINISSLQLVKDTFVDENLRQYYSDIIYNASLNDGRTAYVYILFEHKSYSDPMVCFQLLSYIVKILQKQKQQQQTLQPIFPVVVYHGKDKWRTAANFQSLLNIPDSFKPFFPEFKYWLIDLSGYRDEELKGTVLLQVSLLLLKHIFDEELPQLLPKIFALLRHLLAENKTGLQFIEAVLKYLAIGTDKVTKQELKDTIEATLPKGGDILSTIAQQWIAQGWQDGHREGHREGQQQGLKQGLLEGHREGQQQGLKQGLLEGIELSLKLKFGIEGLRILPEIRQIKNIDLLHAIQSGIEAAKTVTDLRKIYRKIDS